MPSNSPLAHYTAFQPQVFNNGSGGSRRSEQGWVCGRCSGECCSAGLRWRRPRQMDPCVTPDCYIDGCQGFPGLGDTARGSFIEFQIRKCRPSHFPHLPAHCFFRLHMQTAHVTRNTRVATRTLAHMRPANAMCVFCMRYPWFIAAV